MKKDGRYTCEPFEFPVASLDEVFVFHLGIVNLQDTFARGLLFGKKFYVGKAVWQGDVWEEEGRNIRYLSDDLVYKGL